MTLALRYAIRSDVGLLREGNEDSAYAGPHLLAVADGMGGHAAGEVASAATITTIAPLDARHLGPDLVGALADAVATANLRLQELIISDPAIEGMGTTLTALLWSDGYAALCHIGDSRAYRLRNGQFIQITHDHTLVQSLVDEGKITEDDVATHPHRSLLLRALDGRTVAEPDLMPLDTLPGDRFLLCSDGLSGVVTEQTLYQTLSSVRDPDKAALQLVELAIRGGGPDNITCIVADVLDTQVSAVPPTWTPVFAGAAATGAPTDPRQPVRQSSPATRAMRLTRTTPQPAVRDEPTGVWPAGRPASRDNYTREFDTAPLEADGFGTGPNRLDRTGFDGAPGPDEDGYNGRGSHRRSTRGSRHRYNDTVDAGGETDGDDDYGHRGRRRWPIVTGALVLLVILLGGGAYGAWWYNQQQYYVGVHDGYVAIFRGTNQSVAGIGLSSLLTPSTLKVSQLGTNDQSTISQTISKGSVADAKALITQLQGVADGCHQQWTALATWQAQTVKYQDDLVTAAHSKPKIKVPASEAPGPIPAVPDPASCAPAVAFGIPASALPAQAGGTAVTPTPSPSPTPTRTPTPTRSATVKKSATPRTSA
jgi:serine/threonine protein phosphatase PrpC